ncbi:MAG: DUF1467 family protein [Proteobacteria bacterium]|nr:DUF1467 family protein [Pseudomonadota bacterium]
MSLSLGIFTFINAWCVTLFFVMPFFVVRDETAADSDYAAAPKTPKWRRVVLVNSLVALVVTLIVAGVIESGWLSMREAN